MKRLRAYLPWLLSTVFLVATAATALGAGSMGPTPAHNKNQYWNSPVWLNQPQDNWAKIAVKCRDDSDANDPGDWVTIRIWRHAGILPPHSVGNRTFDACRNSPQTKTWNDSPTSNMDGPEDFHFQIQGFSFNGGYDVGRRIDLIPYTVSWGK